MKNEIEIKGTLSKSIDVFFFTASVPILENLKAECRSRQDARGAPLFEAIFDLPWVTEVAAEGRALIVKKKESAAPWNELVPQVAGLIRKFYQEGVPFFTVSFLEATQEKNKAEKQKQTVPYKVNEVNISSPLGKRVQKVLEEKVSSSLASHGGYTSMVDLTEGKVYLYFGGGCQGCSQASVTVKEGIEKLLLKEFPELIGVLDVTNHSAGTNPYFKNA